MEKQAMIRRARIAASVFFGVLALLFVFFWVRSYWWLEHFQGPGLKSGTVNIWSGDGILALQINPRPSSEWKVFVHPHPEGWQRRQSPWAWDSSALRTIAAVPYWLPSLTLALVAVSPWIKSRFSLRTMLLATTLLAIALGLGIWIGR